MGCGGSICQSVKAARKDRSWQFVEPRARHNLSRSMWKIVIVSAIFAQTFIMCLILHFTKKWFCIYFTYLFCSITVFFFSFRYFLTGFLNEHRNYLKSLWNSLCMQMYENKMITASLDFVLEWQYSQQTKYKLIMTMKQQWQATIFFSYWLMVASK